MNEMNIHGHPTVKKLRRTREGRIIAGVCSGAAEFLGIDANILRLALAVATFFGGLGVGVYAVAWLLVPEEGSDSSIVQNLINKQKSDPGSAWHQASAYWQSSQAPHGDRSATSDQPAPQARGSRSEAPADQPPADA